MTTPDASFDRPRVLATAHRLREAAKKLKTDADGTLDKLLETAKKETSVNTRSGEPAPIYGATMTALEEGAESARERVRTIASTLEDDASALEAAARESATEDADNARSVGATDTDIPNN